MEDFQGTDLARMPKPDVIEAAVDKVGSDLAKLLRAPSVEPFTGPAILQGAHRACSSTKFSAIGLRVIGKRRR